MLAHCAALEAGELIGVAVLVSRVGVAVAFLHEHAVEHLPSSRNTYASSRPYLSRVVRRSSSSVTVLPPAAAWVNWLASGPKCSTGVLGLTVSGVSTPHRRTRVCGVAAVGACPCRACPRRRRGRRGSSSVVLGQVGRRGLAEQPRPVGRDQARQDQRAQDRPGRPAAYAPKRRSPGVSLPGNRLMRAMRSGPQELPIADLSAVAHRAKADFPLPIGRTPQTLRAASRSAIGNW